ncbi:MAG: hypothetical protein RLZZ04_1988 [Cyanobacteriota bacterium]|jgi:hypothetical protein
MKRIYLIVVAIFLTLAAAYFRAKKLHHQIFFNDCVAKLQKLERESDSNPRYIINPFQLFPVNAENMYRPTVFGYKDRHGKIVLHASFTQARRFFEGKAAVADKNWYWGFIDSKGQLTIPYKFTGVSDFHGGVAAFTGIKGDYSKQGFIDKNGKIIIVLNGNGGDFATDFSGFKNGRITSSRPAWDPLGLHDGNPHPYVRVLIDCTGEVSEVK